MSFALLAVVLWAWSAPLCRADSKAPIPIEVLLDRVEKAVAADPNVACHYDDPIRHTDKYYFGKGNYTWDSKNFCNPFRTGSFCAEVIEKCQADLSEPYCSSVVSAEQRDRFTDKILRKKVFTKVKTYFDETRRDPLFLSLCCGNLDSCKNYGPNTPKGECPCKDYVTETKLVVLGGLGSGDETGDYDPATHSVEVSEALMLHQRTEENIEYIIAHELGHACQYGKSQGAQFAINNSCFLNMTNMITQDQLEHTLGTKTKECVSNALKEAADRREKNKEGPFCLGSWMREAFADMIAVTRYKGLSHWARPCIAPSDSLHCAPAVFMHCAFTRWPLKSKFCPGGD